MVNWENYDDVLGQLRSIGLLVDALSDDQRQALKARIDADREAAEAERQRAAWKVVLLIAEMTAGKVDLIEQLGPDNTERFYELWTRHLLPLPVVPARSKDLYAAYRHWCACGGVNQAAQLSAFIGNTAKRAGASKKRRRHYPRGQSDFATEQSMVMFPAAMPFDMPVQPLSEHLERFADAVGKWKASTP